MLAKHYLVILMLFLNEVRTHPERDECVIAEGRLAKLALACNISRLMSVKPIEALINTILDTLSGTWVTYYVSRI